MKDVKFQFENKNFVVMGASSGMGRHITLDLARAGAHVLAVARNEERLQEVQKSFPDLIEVQTLDVLEAGPEDWDRVLGEFVEKHGKINGGVYTAGITGMSALRMYNEDLAHRILDTSFFGMTRFIQGMAKKKHAEKGSSYVVFASTAAHYGNRGQFAYSGAKGAVCSAVRSLAKELYRDKHRINSISPGWVETEMVVNSRNEIGDDRIKNIYASYPLGVGKPDDVSPMVLFLLSDAARWITGTDIVVDGGSLAGTD